MEEKCKKAFSAPGTTVVPPPDAKRFLVFFFESRAELQATGPDLA